MSDQPHIAKNVAYGLPFHGIGVCLAILFGRSLCCVKACLFSFYTVRVSVERCFVHILAFVTYLFLFIMVSWERREGVQFW